MTVKLEKLLGSMHRIRNEVPEENLVPILTVPPVNNGSGTDHLAPLTLIWRRDIIIPAFIYLTLIG